jgi:hypothetical protein
MLGRRNRDGGAVRAGTRHHEAVSSPATPRAVFRVSPLMILFALFLSVCAIPSPSARRTCG